MDEFKKNLKQSPGMRFFIFMMTFFVCALIGSAIAGVFTLGNNIFMIKIGQGISSALIFIVPPVVYYAFTRTEPLRQLGFRRPAKGWMLLAGLAVMIVSLPLTNLLGEWNANLKFGEAFKALETWLKFIEETAAELTQRLLEVDNVWGMLGNLLVIALIPAIGEELTFRSLLQQALTRRCKNVHVAVFLSAFIFSFIHFQFYGFLPRLFLGLLLGYLFYYSGSVWTSILMHFFNNGLIVVLTYLNTIGVTQIDPDHLGNTTNIVLLAVSLLLTVGLIWLVAKKQDKNGRE